MNTYTPFTIVRGLILLFFIWPAAIVLGIRSWRMKQGYVQRTPIDGAIAAVTTQMSILFTIALYFVLAIWWFW